MVKKQYGIDKKLQGKAPTTAETNKKNGRKFLAAAGIKQASKREKYSERNPEAIERYGKTFDLLEDEELKANFQSENKNIVAAMLVATDQLADNGETFDAANPKANKRLTAVLGGLFAVALAEIESGNEASSYSPEKLAAIDKKTVKAKQRDERKGKEQASAQKKLQGEEEAARKESRRIKPNVFSVVEGCETKKCALNSYTLTITKPMAMSSQEILENLKSKFTDKASEVAESVTEKMSASDDDLVIDLQEVAEAIDLTEIHIIGGRQNYWRCMVSIAAKGSCDHGNADRCPEVEVQNPEQEIDDTKQNILYMGQGHPKISKLRLYPRTVPFTQTFTWQYFKDTFLMPQNRAPVPYYFTARSCRHYYHSEYLAIIKVHAPAVLGIGFSYAPAYPDAEGGGDQSVFKLSLYNINDLNKYIKDIDSQDIKDIMSTMGLGWVSGMLGFTRKFVRMVTRFTTDEGESAMDGSADEASSSEVSGNEAQSAEDSSAESSKKEKPAKVLTWAWQTPKYHFSYKRTLTEMDNNSRVGYQHQISLSASPFLKFGAKIDLVEMLYSSVAAPAVARQAVKDAAGAVYDKVAGGLDRVYSTLSAFISYIVKGEIAEAQNRPVSGITAQEAEEAIFSASGSFKCVLDINYALEATKSSTGLIWNKKPETGKWEFDESASGLYTGFNLQLTGELTGFLKVTRFVVASGYKFDVMSADNSVPSRMSLELRPFAGLSDTPKLEKFGNFNGLALHDAAYFKMGEEALREKEKQAAAPGRKGSVNTPPSIASESSASQKKMRWLMRKPIQWPEDLEIKKDSKGKAESLDSSVFY